MYVFTGMHDEGRVEGEESSAPASKRLKPTKPLGKFEFYTKAVRQQVKESMFEEVGKEWEDRAPTTSAAWKEFGKEVNRRVTTTVAMSWRELNEAARAPFERQARDEMLSYMQEMAAFRAETRPVAALRRLKFVVEYDGTDFVGWQAQEEDARTVQQVLEAQLGLLTGEKAVRVHGASRTDRGVHAEGQVRPTPHSRVALVPRCLYNNCIFHNNCSVL